MILRFCSGSVTPASLPRKRSLASTTRRSALKASRNSDSTCAASPARCRPVSTKMQVRRVADRPEHQRRRHRRIDAARQAADRAPGRPDLARATAATASSTKPAIVQLGSQPQMRNRKLRQDLAAARGVRHLGVELHAPELARRRRHRRRRAVGALADDREAGRQRLDAVAVAHPDRDLLAGGEAVEQLARLGARFTVGAAVLAPLGRRPPCRRAAAPSAACRSRCPRIGTPSS